MFLLIIESIGGKREIHYLADNEEQRMMHLIGKATNRRLVIVCELDPTKQLSTLSAPNDTDYTQREVNG